MCVCACVRACVCACACMRVYMRVKYVCSLCCYLHIPNLIQCSNILCITLSLCDPLSLETFPMYTARCDPPCVHGSCITNNMCSCATGFEGPQCTDEGTNAVISND